MTLILHLGVIDQPYQEPGQTPPRKSKVSASTKARAAAKASSQTTGEVAEILEGKYHVMETFFDLHEEEIANDFAEAMAGSLENLIAGAPPSNWPYGEAESATEERFKRFLDDKEMDGTATPGVPTKAARRGVNHRLKIKRGEPRPSFIDTGLYQSSFKAWVEES